MLELELQLVDFHIKFTPTHLGVDELLLKIVRSHDLFTELNLESVDGIVTACWCFLVDILELFIFVGETLNLDGKSLVFLH